MTTATPTKPRTPKDAEFDAIATEGRMPLAPEGSAERLAADAEESADPITRAAIALIREEVTETGTLTTSAQIDNLDGLVFVTDYDANSEAIDRPLEPTPPTPELFTSLHEPEMWDGQEVTAHLVKFGGSVPIGRAADADRAIWGGLKQGREVYFSVKGTVGGASYTPRKNRDGDVVALDFERKVKVVAVSVDGSRFEEEDDSQLTDALAELEETREAHVDAVDLLCRLRDGMREWLSDDLDDPDVEDARLTLLAMLEEAADYAVGVFDDLSDAAEDDEPEEPSALQASLAEALA